MARADRGLLNAKENGRNRVVSFAYDETLSVTPQSKKSKIQWREIMNLEHTKSRMHSELVSFVPKCMVYDKLLGFAREFAAVVTDTQANFTTFEIDCKNVPTPRKPHERPGKYRFHIGINEIELRSGRDRAKVRPATLLQIVVSPLNARDRREDSYHNQCTYLLRALQAYLVAEPFTETLQADLLRIIKSETEAAT